MRRRVVLVILFMLPMAQAAMTAELTRVPAEPLSTDDSSATMDLTLIADCPSLLARHQPGDATLRVDAAIRTQAAEGVLVAAPDTVPFDGVACLSDPTGHLNVTTPLGVAVSSDVQAFQDHEITVTASLPEHALDVSSAEANAFVQAAAWFTVTATADQALHFVQDDPVQTHLSVAADGNSPVRIHVTNSVMRAIEPESIPMLLRMEPGETRMITFAFEPPRGEWGDLSTEVRFESYADRGGADVGAPDELFVPLRFQQQGAKSNESPGLGPLAPLALLGLAGLFARRRA